MYVSVFTQDTTMVDYRTLNDINSEEIQTRTSVPQSLQLKETWQCCVNFNLAFRKSSFHQLLKVFFCNRTFSSYTRFNKLKTVFLSI